MTDDLGPSGKVLRAMKQLRKLRDWNVDQMADAMASHGVPWTRNVVMNAEAGRKQSVTAEELVALSIIFGVPVGELLGELPERRLLDEAAVQEVSQVMARQFADTLRSWGEVTGGSAPLTVQEAIAAAKALKKEGDTDA